MPPVALELVNAPALLTPAPFNVSALVFASVLPLRSKDAPSATVMAPAEAPNAVVLPAFNVPALIVVPPEYVLLPDKVVLPLEF